MEPADILASDVLAAVAGFVFVYADRFDSRGCDVELLFATTFERDEPEGRAVD